MPQTYHTAAQRVQQMELYFDLLRHAQALSPHHWQQDPLLRQMLRILTDYYESGLWLEDFRRDEQGLFPEDMKRGILSEDGFYDFLTEISQFSGNTPENCP